MMPINVVSIPRQAVRVRRRSGSEDRINIPFSQKCACSSKQDRLNLFAQQRRSRYQLPLDAALSLRSEVTRMRRAAHACAIGLLQIQGRAYFADNHKGSVGSRTQQPRLGPQLDAASRNAEQRAVNDGVQVTSACPGVAGELQQLQQIRVEIAVAFRDDIHHHHADAVLQVARALDGERAAVRGSILVGRAEPVRSPRRASVLLRRSGC